MRPQRRINTVVVVGASVALVVLFAGVGAGTTAGGSGPLADAGLDQTVTEGETVYLDAGGSTAPAESIDSYEWQIETPGGSTVEPECSTCMQTSFDANEVGEYAVSVTVTDDQGRTDTDTLYVTVEPYDPPEVTVDGPSTVTAGDQRTVSVSATATEEPLASVLWHHEGSPHTSERLSADWSATHQTTITFAEPGIHEINATVVDRGGYQSSDGTTVRVVPPKPHLAVSITDINSSVTTGETVVATTQVENVGEATATQAVSLTRNGTTVDSGSVSVTPGSKRTLRLVWSTTEEDDGTYAFTAHTTNETDTRYVTVNNEENDSGGSSGGGSGDGRLYIMQGNLDAEVVESADGDRKAVLTVRPPEDVDHDPEEIDPSNHNVTFVAEDGTAYDIGDGGQIPQEGLDTGGGKIKADLSKDVTLGNANFGIGEYQDASDEVTIPEKKKYSQPDGEVSGGSTGSSGTDNSASSGEISGSADDSGGSDSFDTLPGVVGPGDGLGDIGSDIDTDSDPAPDPDPAPIPEPTPDPQPDPDPVDPSPDTGVDTDPTTDTGLVGLPGGSGPDTGPDSNTGSDSDTDDDDDTDPGGPGIGPGGIGPIGPGPIGVFYSV